MSYADRNEVSRCCQCLEGNELEWIGGLERACSSPNVCSICTLEGTPRVSRTIDTIEGARQDGLTMIDLSTLLRSFRRVVGAGGGRSLVLGRGAAFGRFGSAGVCPLISARGRRGTGSSRAIEFACLFRHQRRSCGLVSELDARLGSLQAGMRSTTGLSRVAARKKQAAMAARRHVPRWHSVGLQRTGTVWRAAMFQQHATSKLPAQVMFASCAREDRTRASRGSGGDDMAVGGEEQRQPYSPPVRNVR